MKLRENEVGFDEFVCFCKEKIEREEYLKVNIFLLFLGLCVREKGGREVKEKLTRGDVCSLWWCGAFLAYGELEYDIVDL